MIMPNLNLLTPIFFFYLQSYCLTNLHLTTTAAAGKHPLTPKAYLIRYWNTHISNDLPKPKFFLNKASPLTAVQSIIFAKLAAQNAFSTHLPSFCSSANLHCFPSQENLSRQSDSFNFTSYLSKNFTSYGSSGHGGTGSFKNYSDLYSLTLNTFKSYSSESVNQNDKFASYARHINIGIESFNGYGNNATGGSGEFKAYTDNINIPHAKFASYSENVNGRKQKFAAYSTNSNVGDSSFAGYGKNSTDATNDFTTYSNDSNIVVSSFSGYGEAAKRQTDNFTAYGFIDGHAENNFTSYAGGGDLAVELFKSYRDSAYFGDDSFKSYAKDSKAAKVGFVSYGQTTNGEFDSFAGYGKGKAESQEIGFKIYGVNTTFKNYAKKGITFGSYLNESSPSPVKLTTMEHSGRNVWVEPGKFFREKMLKSGTVMQMPDIVDKMPKRSFLPRAILSKLPFSAGGLKNVFQARDDSRMARMITGTLAECERKPSRGETKRCVGSAEDMIDFATDVLGRDIAVRTTESTNGSGQNVMLGIVKGLNGGRISKSVSCHQSLFPYLLYYCHSVPQVRVYVADIHDPNTKFKINHGIAICHIDTSDWSPTHGAFVALGSGPGKIEVCHWIFENDMNWAVA